MILGLIPARGGSKGLPQKNIKPFHGKPLIAYAIEEARNTPEINEVIVNTDDPTIARIAKEHGATIPFMRPKNLAQDTTPMIQVIKHTITWYKQNKTPIDTIILLQPTSPLRTRTHIKEALQLYFKYQRKNPETTVVSVTPSKHHPYWMYTIHDTHLQAFLPEKPLITRRQDLPKVYALNGAIYIAPSHVIMKDSTLITPHTIPYIMNPYESIDIDNNYDFKIAEALYNELHM